MPEKIDLPKTFTDAAGRSWTVTVVWSTKKRILDVAALDLNDLVVIDGKKGSNPLLPFADLLQDDERFLGVLYAALKPDCEKLQPPLSEEDFRDGITGNSLTDAKNAFSIALHDFFPDPRKEMIGWAIRTGLQMDKRAKTELAKISDKMSTTLNTHLDKAIAAMPDLDQALEKALSDTQSTRPSSGAPASAESIPTH